MTTILSAQQKPFVFGIASSQPTYLEVSKLFHKDPNLLKAVRYFNREVISHNALDPYKKMTWEHAIELFRLFRGEDENPDLHRVRLDSVQKLDAKYKHSKFTQGFPDNTTLMNLVNRKVASRQEAIFNAAIIYYHLSRNQLFYQCEEGFDTAMSRNDFDIHDGLPTVQGHHRMTWFLMNKHLHNNRLGFFYFNNGEYKRDISISRLEDLIKKQV